MNITGTEINYYLVCIRKLWLYTHGITMEQNSNYVDIGKAIHEYSFEREHKEVLIDGMVMLDFINKKFQINETKKSKAMENATRYQILYYIYYLKNKGVDGVTGIIHYMDNHTKEEVCLSEEDEKQIKEIITKINEIKIMDKPPNVNRIKACSKCSYFELCFC